MAQKKLLRFAQLSSFSNTLEHPEGMAGKWSNYFKQQHPIILELACGRGEYTVALSRMHPQNNYIGVDVKGNRMYLGAKQALEENLHNAAFLRTQIERIDEFFAPEEVNEIWITFPDPQLRTSKAKKRLTHPRFLRKYRQILKQNGLIHLKTDSPHLYHFTLRVIDKYGLQLHAGNSDVYANAHAAELAIKTHYERLDIAGTNKIYYLAFSLPNKLPLLDDELQKELVATENIQP